MLQRFIEEILGFPFTYVYIDDVLRAIQNKERHKFYSRQIFKRIDHFGLKLNANKCISGVSCLEFLEQEGISLAAIED